MTAPLSPELERFVQSEVESGHFASREAVKQDGSLSSSSIR
jgi:Arc/MetJ-type ribon-helix-helix transcriptional regulator